jgi:hypothetical protein
MTMCRVIKWKQLSHDEDYDIYKFNKLDKYFFFILIKFIVDSHRVYPPASTFKAFETFPIAFGRSLKHIHHSGVLADRAIYIFIPRRKEAK